SAPSASSPAPIAASALSPPRRRPSFRRSSGKSCASCPKARRWPLKAEMNPDSLRRKLRALAAIIADSGATAAERENAKRIRGDLKAKLAEHGVPQGDWSDAVFRFGRSLRRAKAATAPPPSIEGTGAKAAFRLGRALRQAAKKASEP